MLHCLTREAIPFCCNGCVFLKQHFTTASSQFCEHLYKIKEASILNFCDIRMMQQRDCFCPNHLLPFYQKRTLARPCWTANDVLTHLTKIRPCVPIHSTAINGTLSILQTRGKRNLTHSSHSLVLLGSQLPKASQRKMNISYRGYIQALGEE